MAHSLWFQIAQAFEARLKAVAEAQSVRLLSNPALPIDMGRADAGNQLALFVMQRGDKVIDQPGQRREKRQMRLVVGVASQAAGALASADELHFAARDALRSEALRAALRALGQGIEGAAIGVVREVEIEPEIKEMTAQGSVLMSAYEVEYFQTYPSAA